MIIKIQGSASQPYEVDTDKITCTCPNFRYRCSHYSVNSKERLCKHLLAVFEEHPELAPAWTQMLIKGNEVEPTLFDDGKLRYPISFFDSYVTDIRSILSNYSDDIMKFEFCGSYRRLESMVSDLDVLIVLNEGHSPEDFLDYCENIMGYEKLWRGDKKASYKIDGIVQVDFKFVPLESWPFAVMHYTGSKTYNIKCRQKAISMGYSLSEYGLKGKDGEVHSYGCQTERDIHELLHLPYVEPKDRK